MSAATVAVIETDGRPSSLTPAQRRLLRLRAQGLTVKEVAWQLGISRHTAHALAQQAYGRLDVAGPIHAFIALGWLVVPSDD